MNDQRKAVALMRIRRPVLDARKVKARLGLPANASTDDMVDTLAAIENRRRQPRARRPEPAADDSYPREWLSPGERGEVKAGTVTRLAD